jgi:hypothetical protein
LRGHRHKNAWLTGAAGLLSVAAVASAVRAQVLDVDLRTSVFYEPSPTSKLTVINPALAVAARPAEFLKIHAAYEADIVSGASEAVKAGPVAGVDVITAATSFDDTRHVASGGFELTRETTNLAVSYAYGTESDYRSHSIAVTASTAFLQRNTEIALSYARGFDQVCTTAFAESDDPSVRARLDSSDGCFTKAEDRKTRDVDLDNLQAAWTQSWTPVFTTQAVLSGALQHGFLGNPYRAVVIAPNGDEALENHPENRARAALSLRGKLYVRAIETAFGASVRLYRDTWDVFSQTYEVDAERYLFPGFRVQVRGRYYTQTEAVFYSDDYTGGEPVYGPRGRYWTGDRELSPMSSFALGGRLLYGKKATPETRLLGFLLGISASVGIDLMQTDLEHFTWSGRAPDDTTGLLGTLGISANF